MSNSENEYQVASTIEMADLELGVSSPAADLQRQRTAGSELHRQSSEKPPADGIKFKKAKKLGVGKQYMKSIHELTDHGKFEVM
jgi:hypothetical protein